MVLVPALCDQKSSRAVVMNVGDPFRKNTLCVEISPASSEVTVNTMSASIHYTIAKRDIPCSCT